MFGIRKGKSTIFDQIDHRQANTSGRNGERNCTLCLEEKLMIDYERSFIEHC